jgi:hypothetical protein
MLEVVSPPGDHKYVPPIGVAVAVKLDDCPEHIVPLFTLTVGV